MAEWTPKFAILGWSRLEGPETISAPLLAKMKCEEVLHTDRKLWILGWASELALAPCPSVAGAVTH